MSALSPPVISPTHLSTILFLSSSLSSGVSLLQNGLQKELSTCLASRPVAPHP